ncbi:hypothetical protein BX666DRAFT_182657 [Dichotomocladium elegans]|nr:hypothetical protein BX666DRAFT_182657 [Dichotomocladium elegans]
MTPALSVTVITPLYSSNATTARFTASPLPPVVLQLPGHLSRNHNPSLLLYVSSILLPRHIMQNSI